MAAEVPDSASASSRLKYIVFSAVLVVAMVLDQGTKIWARASLKPRFAPMVIIDGFFDLRYSENPGIAFGLLRGVPGGRYLLLGVGVIALGVIVSLLRKQVKPGQLRLAAELGLLGGGALGNIVDRALRGVVSDFVVWKYHGYEWPTFNVADAALVVGIAALMLDMKTETPKPAPDQSPAKRRT